MQKERIFKVRIGPHYPKGHKWFIMERILNENSKHEWVIVASRIPSEQKANQIIDIYKGNYDGK